MSQVPRELIRQVQICTRSASGLSDYSPSDPTLPALPPLSAAIAAYNPSPPQSCCRNCKGMLLRGSESIICIYCGLGPHRDAVPDPIGFTSTIGYKWLLRSLHLDGSEMIDPTFKIEENQGYNSPKSLTPLSDFLHYKIPWLAETEKPETTFPEKQSEHNEGSMRFAGLAPDTFFLKSNKNAVSDVSNEQLFNHNQIGPDDGKDVAAVGFQDLFQNAQLAEPAGISSKPKSSEDFSEWKADFQFADSDNQHKFPGASVDSENNVEDLKSFDLSPDLGVNLASHIDSVFGSGKNLNDGKPKENPAVVSAFDDWNSDDVWNNMSSSPPHFSGAFDSVVSTKDGHEVDHTSLVDSKDTSADLFQDFQLQTNYTENTGSKTTNEEHTSVDGDLFEDWNDFTGSTYSQFPSQNVWTGGDDYQVSTSDQKSSEIDLFSFDNKSDKGDFGSFSQPDLFSTSTSNDNATIQANAIVSESPASDRLFDGSGPFHESEQSANDRGAPGNSTEDDVKMLISQMHDLSFMLETNLCIPSGPDTSKSS